MAAGVLLSPVHAVASYSQILVTYLCESHADVFGIPDAGLFVLFVCVCVCVTRGFNPVLFRQ